MTTHPQSQQSPWTEEQWRDFLMDLKAKPGRFIPVIGPELMVIDDGGVTRNVLSVLGERVADKLDIMRDDLPADADLKDVVQAYLMQRKRYDLDAPHAAIVEAFSETDWKLPEPVRKLISIRHFNLFLNATWLPFLRQALEKERNVPVVERGNTPGSPMDDFEDDDIRTSLCIFNLFGSTRLSTSGCPLTFAVTDDDLLYSMHQLISNPPQRLSSHLLEENRELLVCGCSFSNWLARFFFYSLTRTAPVAAGHGLRMRGVAENNRAGDESLRAFWARLNIPVCGQSAVAFVDELYDRWHAKYGDVPEPLKGAADRPPAESNPFSAGQVFISYDRADADAAQRVATRLKDAKLPVWLDTNCLENGHLYRARIRSNIQYCSVFVPLISSNAIRNIETKGFMYREEWAFAQEQAELRRDGGFGQNEFILPVCIDASVDLYDIRLPQYIRDRHVVSLASEVPDAWLASVRDACKQFARGGRGGAR